jgi:hypothetical protein
MDRTVPDPWMVLVPCACTSSTSLMSYGSHLGQNGMICGDTGTVGGRSTVVVVVK